jgi:hypothetical protein
LPLEKAPFSLGQLETLNESCLGVKGAILEAVRHPLFGQGRVEPGTIASVRDYLSPERMSEKFLAAYRAVLAANQT